MWNAILYNWKSSGSAVCGAIAGLVAIFWPDKSGQINQVAAAVALLFGAILGLVSKDGDKSGLPTKPNP